MSDRVKRRSVIGRLLGALGFAAVPSTAPAADATESVDATGDHYWVVEWHDKVWRPTLAFRSRARADEEVKYWKGLRPALQHRIVRVATK